MIDISKFDATGTPPRPNGNTYWVVPHKFLAGEYPGGKDPVTARKKINQFLVAGIRHFVDLTEVGDQLAPYQAILSEVVACWLQEHGRTPDDALAELNAKWSTVEKIYRKPESPETSVQVGWVKSWAQRRKGVQQLLVRDRYRGALLGLAVGDALGTTLEFKAPGTFKPITDLVGGGPFSLKPGQWTDDTSMALCLAESLIEKRGFDPRDQMDRYCRWWKEGYLSSTGTCFDIGITVQTALAHYLRSREPLAGSTDPFTAGNGSLMRLAPVPLAFRRDFELAIHIAGESSRTTHAAPTAIDACRYFAGLLLGALEGRSKEELLSSFFYPAPDEQYWKRHPLSPEIAEIAGGSFKQKQPPAIIGSGFVVRSLEAALWRFTAPNLFVTERCAP